MSCRNDDANIHSSILTLKDDHINLSRLRLQFYGLNCLIETDWQEVLARLESDFSAFKKNDKHSSVDFYLLISQKSPLSIQFPVSSRITDRGFVKTYYRNSILVNDYQAEVRSLLNLKTESGHIASLQIHRAHEIAYLMILSRIGKKMEDLGYHKIHAMALASKETIVCLSMSSGEGKSTIAQSMLKDDSDLKILSDDCPVIGSDGMVRAFPIRLGLSEKGGLYHHTRHYELNRMRYGVKKLLDINHVNYQKMDVIKKKQVLIFGKRNPSEKDIKMLKISRIVAFIYLTKPLIIGVGLPLIFEYFWEPGWRDMIRKMKIGMSRLRASFWLCWKSNCYSLVINNDLEAAKSTIKKHF